jgi:indolepyruvate ferredoxin oxidoreductase, beta subunit
MDTSPKDLLPSGGAPSPVPAAGLPTPRLIRIAILAMGGEGGGVLADWLVDLAEHAGHVAQTTSVPGVAQRTGATIYYVEMLIGAGVAARPVMALMPLPGDVDIVIASELMEAARAVQRGLVTPERTVLVASTHRVYAIAEKTAMGDGRADPQALLASARAAAARFVGFDMARMAEASGSVISAVLFGALAATGALPYSRAQFEATIERGGVGVKPSLRAFDAAHTQVSQGRAEDTSARASASPAIRVETVSLAASTLTGGDDVILSVPPPAVDDALPRPSDPVVRALIDRVGASFSGDARTMALEGVRRLLDYQGPGWAAAYLDRLEAVRLTLTSQASKSTNPSSGSTLASVPATAASVQPPSALSDVHAQLLLSELARHLALWMSWEDTVRVAELKVRASRFDRVRKEVRLGDAQVLAIQEYLHPRLQEIAETLPAPLGRHLLSGGWLGRLVDRLASRGRVVETSSLRGFLLLWGVSRLKRWRPKSLRCAVETARIDAWLSDVRAALMEGDVVLATEIVRCQRLVKGYGDTHARGWRNFEQLQAWWRGASTRSAQGLAALRAAALADDQGHALAKALAASDPAQS